ncbi:MAG: hypothetical protein H6744_15775 [Deltaproteobacteria bacterium]|nr:hypothetical protein [Deltaproteobacteria bacterium]
MTRTLPIALSLAATGLFACGRLPPRAGADPLYDFDTVWFNDGVGGLTPWEPRDREAITEAVVSAERRAEARWRGEKAVAGSKAAGTRPRRAASRAPRTAPPARPAPPRAREPQVAAARPAPAPALRAQLPAPRPRAEIAAPAPVASAAPAPRPPTARIAPAPEPPPVDQPLTRPLLGDGSVPGELLAAAQRVLGVRDGFGDRTFLAHLVSVAAVPIEASAPRARYNAAVWEELARSGRTFEAGRPEPGDLAFFHRVDDLDGDGSANDPFSAVAVVERVLPSGVVICIGEVHGEVRRFALDPTRPWVVRDEATGEEVNSTLRRRSLEDPPGTAVLAGGLLAGYARP